MKNTQTKVISSGKKTKQIVVLTTVKNRTNRKGQPYRESVTKHVTLNYKIDNGGTIEKV